MRIQLFTFPLSPMLRCVLKHASLGRRNWNEICVSNFFPSRALTASTKQEGRYTNFRVDRSGLQGNVDSKDPSELNFARENKEVPSPLTKDLQSLIKLKGPLTLHDFMAQSLNHSPHGYYQHKLEKIGIEGDFITSPEISQIFGEMIGVWCYFVWESLGKPNKINLVELGPGKGTLMKDLLHVCEKFGGFKSCLNVHMIELSQTMRRYQHAALVDGLESPTHNELIIVDGEKLTESTGVPVQWHSFLQQIPVDDTPIIFVGQEFLDAFPVHQFSYTNRGWREKLVDSDYSADSPHHFRIVMSPTATPAVMTLLQGNNANEMFRIPAKVEKLSDFSNRINKSTPRFISPDSTSRVANNSYPKVDSIRHPDHNHKEHHTFEEGDGLEMSPLSIAICEDIAKRVVRSGGAALLVDYGEDFTQEDSLRGFRRHGQVSILSEPGRVDVTADVDFSVCARAAFNNGATVLPLATQGEYLMRMGVVERVEQLVDAPSTTDEQAEVLVESLRRLVDPAEMGRKYKVLSITSPGLKVPGFE